MLRVENCCCPQLSVCSNQDRSEGAVLRRLGAEFCLYASRATTLVERGSSLTAAMHALAEPGTAHSA